MLYTNLLTPTYHVIKDEVERAALPVRPVHGELPQLDEREVAVVQRVEQHEQARGQQRARKEAHEPERPGGGGQEVNKTLQLKALTQTKKYY